MIEKLFRFKQIIVTEHNSHLEKNILKIKKKQYLIYDGLVYKLK